MLGRTFSELFIPFKALPTNQREAAATAPVVDSTQHQSERAGAPLRALCDVIRPVS
jgi:hypothetical protein